MRPAGPGDHDAIWSILEPVIRASETYAFDRDMSREAALAYWTGGRTRAFVADEGGRILGTYYIRPNQAGGGSHVCNCGYVTAADAAGRGIARLMCRHSLDHARGQGFRAMQFNFVVGSNERAVQLWQSMGFDIVGRLPQAFDHPRLGYIDALVMFRTL
ncbi:GNAT family N-acetyltransferase [Pelagerythrobacter marensis]|uniref:GNAT family N-acetyltransferase n=1 Tax=Pelagerythrobacter marensis TaxID=543877 RepID=A0ABZ2D6R4_9SPHN